MPDQAGVPAAHMFVEVALPLPLRQTFTYILPRRMAAAGLGARVAVPFGNRTIIGYLVALYEKVPADLDVDPASLKQVNELVDIEPLITPEILSLTRWTAEYYAASWGEVLKAALPAGINQPRDKVVRVTEAGQARILQQSNVKAIKWQILRAVDRAGTVRRAVLESEFGKASTGRALRELSDDELIIIAEVAATAKVGPKLRKTVKLLSPLSDAVEKAANVGQTAVVNSLSDAGGRMLFTELQAASGAGASAINTLARKGVLAIELGEVQRDPLADTNGMAPAAITLNPDQSNVLSEITASLDARIFSAFLLHGVTGSGKTEVYIHAMARALELGFSALMLVPEIALTPVFSRRLRATFGTRVAILHSNLSPGERFDEWRRIYRGEASVVIGTRSAIFAPLVNVGLLIVDEEHDTSYRQNESPFYNARDTAVMRASLAGATVVLGSATPALETYQNAQVGKYTYLRLRERIGGRPLARAELIDMRDVFRSEGKDVVVSPQLGEAIEETYRRGEQTIILLNRRGFSSFVLCRTCGQSLRCPHCDITLTYHRGQQKLICHYCGHNANVPQKCPFCDSEFLYFIGEGTEQLEDILVRRFPDLRIARVDRDTMAVKGKLAATLNAFDEGETDMLVGTQMLAKGHDFHNVTLVGVISVDTGLGLPDFRSAERAFQLLTQVAGRAGRGALPGRVLIQTYYPEHYALRYAREQDFEGFFREELRYRQHLHYPPYVVLASVLIKHTDLRTAAKSASNFRSALDRANAGGHVRVLGPAAASVARIKNEYRMQIILKSVGRTALRETIDAAVAIAHDEGADLKRISIEIDPINLL